MMQLDLSLCVFRALERQPMFRAGDRIGVGVSGGADSVALLLLLEHLRERLGIGIAVLHFNHQLRGLESDADEQFVAAHGGCATTFSPRPCEMAARRTWLWRTPPTTKRKRC
jgi:tRNA(Ile)-lysidine synthase